VTKRQGAGSRGQGARSRGDFKLMRIED